VLITDAAVSAGGLIIGLTLSSSNIVFIPVTGVNPARSLGPATFAGSNALAQVWQFAILPPVAGAIAGWLFRAKVLTAD
jgi:aquaporin Z